MASCRNNAQRAAGTNSVQLAPAAVGWLGGSSIPWVLHAVSSQAAEVSMHAESFINKTEVKLQRVNAAGLAPSEEVVRETSSMERALKVL
jgi:hypothetical protein